MCNMLDDTLKITVQRLKALSDATRLKLLGLLSARPMCVCELTYALGLSQPTVSRHMKQLEDAGFVSRKREGSWTIFSIDASDDQSRELLEPVMGRVGQSREIMELLDRLKGVDRCVISGDGRRMKDEGPRV